MKKKMIINALDKKFLSKSLKGCLLSLGFALSLGAPSPINAYASELDTGNVPIVTVEDGSYDPSNIPNAFVSDYSTTLATTERAQLLRTTSTWTQPYRNLMGINVVHHVSSVQWEHQGGSIVRRNGMWQTNRANIGFSFDTERDVWNNNTQTNQSVRFTSGLPTPWGHVGGSNFTSRMLININGNGTSTMRLG